MSVVTAQPFVLLMRNLANVNFYRELLLFVPEENFSLIGF